MNRRYETLNLNERKNITLTLTDNDGSAISPSAAYYTIEDSDGDIVVSESEALVTINVLTATVPSEVTETTGIYKVEWKARVGTLTYYYSTDLYVVDL